MSTRSQAATALAQVIRQRGSLDSAMEQAKGSLEGQDLAFFKSLCFGVCRHYISLSALFDLLVSEPLKSKDADIKALILLGIFQIDYLRTPNHAAINESVSAAKKLKKYWATKLINGVLRTYLRERDDLQRRVAEQQSVVFDHPEWLAKRVLAAWPQQGAAILQANNQQAPLTLRVNQRLNSRAELSALLAAQGLMHQLCQFAPEGLRLDEACDVSRLPGFSEGSCSVQDEAAQLCAQLLDLAGARRVLDLCCAPGGKTCHIGEAAPQLDEIVALDLEAARLQRVEENLQRLKLKATLVCAAAEALDSWWDGKYFDRILVDAPCSATGVIRRHPDIKLLRRDSDIAALTTLQGAILDAAWQALAPGGLLLYATCSILPDENEKVIAAFVAAHEDAIHLPIDASWGESRPFGRQLFPQPGGHDGFYYARLRKRSRSEQPNPAT